MTDGYTSLGAVAPNAEGGDPRSTRGSTSEDMRSLAPTAPTVAIVTAWQNHLELCGDYFTAVDAAQPDQLVVVDDGSDPPLTFAAVRLEQPAGFCAASNAGLAEVECDIALMLNNDVKALRADWLAGIVPLVEPGVIVAPLRFDERAPIEGVKLPYADGWCLAGLTEELRALGGWDERYDEAGPAYYSDNALSLMARLNGMRLRECQPGLVHKGGSTGGVDRAAFNRALAANEQIFREQAAEVLK